MTTRALDGSPQRYARIAGGLYVFLGVVALFGEMYVRGKVIDPGAGARREALPL